MAPLAGPSLPPSPRGPGRVHPHVPHADQLPQHQADGRCMSPPYPHLAHHSTVGAASPSSSSTFLWVLLAAQDLMGTEGGGRQLSRPAGGRLCSSTRGSREPGPAGPQVSVREGAEPRSHGNPRGRVGHRSSGVAHTSLSGWILTVSLFTDEETEAQSQGGAPQVTQLVHDRPGAPLPHSRQGSSHQRRVMVGPTPCLLPLSSVAPSAVGGRHSSWSKRFIPLASSQGLSLREASPTPHPPAPRTLGRMLPPLLRALFSA